MSVWRNVSYTDAKKQATCSHSDQMHYNQMGTMALQKKNAAISPMCDVLPLCLSKAQPDFRHGSVFQRGFIRMPFCCCLVHSGAWREDFKQKDFKSQPNLTDITCNVCVLCQGWEHNCAAASSYTR